LAKRFALSIVFDSAGLLSASRAASTDPLLECDHRLSVGPAVQLVPDPVILNLT